MSAESAAAAALPALAVSEYAAFISYSHAADSSLARRVQWALEHFGQALPYRRRLRVFRDETNLAANPDLWGEIATALDASGAFVLLASPRAANSPWVQKEVARFLARCGPKRLCIVLTDGATPWTDPGETDPSRQSVPENLRAEFARRNWEPLVVDLRPFRGRGRMALHGTDFFGRIATVVALVLDQDKDRIFGEHLRAQRRVVAGVALVAVALGALAVVAANMSRLASQRLRQAVDVAQHIHAVVDRELEPVPGALPVRRKLLDASETMLDELGAGVAEDTGVVAESIEAQLAKADLAIERASLKDAQMALVAAETLAARLRVSARMRPEWAILRARVEQRIGEVARMQGRMDQARDSLERSNSLLRQAEERFPSAPRVLEARSGTVFTLSRLYGELGLSQLQVQALREDAAVSRRRVALEGRSARSLVSLATTLIELADTLAELGAEGDARAALDEAERTLQASPQGATPQQATLLGLAASRADLQAISDPAGAVDAYERVRSQAREAARTDVGGSTFAVLEALALEKKALVLQRLLRLDDALATARERAEVAAALARREPGRRDWAREVARARNRVAEILTDRGDLDAAESEYREARATLRAQQPLQSSELSVLERLLGGLANVYALQGRDSDALAALDEEKGLLAALLREAPSVVPWQHSLAVTEVNSAGALQRLDRWPEAARRYDAALALSEDLAKGGDNRLRLSLVGNLIAAGDALAERGEWDVATARYARAREVAATLPGVERTIHEAWLEERRCVLRGLAPAAGVDASVCDQAVRSLEALPVGTLSTAPVQYRYAAALVAAATSRLDANRPTEAMPLLKQAWEILRRSGERQAPSEEQRSLVLGTLQRLASASRELGDHGSALKYTTEQQRLARAHHDSHPASLQAREDLAESTSALADAHDALGHAGAALTGYREALRLRRSVIERDATSVSAARRLGVSLQQLARALKPVEATAALALARERLRLYESLVTRAPAGSLAADLGSARLEMARVLTAQERWREALSELEHAKGLYGPLVSRDPAVVEWREALGDVYGEAARVLQRLERWPDALRSIDAEIDVRQATLGSSRRVQESLAIAWMDRGDILESLGEATAASEAFARAQETWRLLVAKAPATRSYRAGLAAALDRVASRHKEVGQLAAARAEMDEALRVRQRLLAETPNDTRTRLRVAISQQARGWLLAQLGESADALAAFRASREARLAVANVRHDRDNELAIANVTRGAADLLRPAQGWAAVEGDYREAKARLDHLHAADPGDVEVAQELAVLEQRLGFAASDRKSKAEAEAALASASRLLVRVVQARPSHAPAVLDSVQADRTWADALLLDGEVRKAGEVLSAALRRLELLLGQQPTLGSGHAIRSSLLSDIGDRTAAGTYAGLALVAHEEAVSAATTATSLAPDSPGELATLADAHQRLAAALVAAQRPDEALPHRARAVAALTLAVAGDRDRAAPLLAALAALQAEAAVANPDQVDRARWWVRLALADTAERGRTVPEDVRDRLQRFAGDVPRP